MTATQISNEVLESYVQQGLEKLRKGELWISFHLHENDGIFESGTPAPTEPDPNDKGSNYYKFFDSVVTDIATHFVLDKKDKKRIRQKLHSQWKQWYALIMKDSNNNTKITTTTATTETNEANDNDLKDHIPKKSKKSTTKKATGAVKVKKSKEKTEKMDVVGSTAADGDEAIEGETIIPVVPKKQRRNLEDKKRQFEEARDLILKDVPKEVKDRFGEIFFTKWGTQTLPCLAMNPYSVPPGNVRDTWLDMYDKVKAANRLKFMTNLVYWYGSSKDPNNAYSFIESKKLIPYETAVKKELDHISDVTWQKYHDGKQLTPSQRFFIEGILELRSDLPKEPHERFGCMKRDFMEAYAITSDEEDFDLEANEEGGGNAVNDDDVVDGGGNHDASMQKPKKKKAKTKSPKDKSPKDKEPKKASAKRKKDVEEFLEENDQEPVPVKKAKKKKKKSEDIQETKDNSIVKEEPTNNIDPEPMEENAASLPLGAGNKDDPIAPSNIMIKREEPDDDYKFAMAESESDGEHDADEDFNLGKSAPAAEPTEPGKGKKKAAKVDGKEPPKKKEKKVKHKLDKSIKKEKEVRTEEQRLKRAQKLFAISEKEFHPIFVGWLKAIDDKDDEKIANIMEEISSRVEKVHFSLMADVHELLKASKRVLSNDRKDVLKTVRSALKIQYDEKKRDIPPEFKPQRKFPKIEVPAEVDTPPLTSPPVLVKSNDSSNSIVEDIPKTTLSAAQIKREPSVDKVVEKPEPEITVSQKEVKVERKKFSLGNLMRPTSEASKSGIKIEKTMSSSSFMSSTQKQQQSIPAWMTGKSSISKPDDDNRAFAIEFLEQAAPFIPCGQDVNHRVIAHALEAAIYESVKKGDPSWLDKYWKKIDDIVVAISGDKGPGSISVMIASGEFESPESVVRLSDAAIYDSFLGRPVFLSP